MFESSILYCVCLDWGTHLGQPRLAFWEIENWGHPQAERMRSANGLVRPFRLQPFVNALSKNVVLLAGVGQWD